MRSVFLAVLALLALLPCAGSARGQEPNTQDLVAGVLARSEAVFSGRLKYRVTSGFRGKVASLDTTMSLVFTKGSWRLEQSYRAADMPKHVRKDLKNPPDLSKLKGNLEIKTTSHSGKLVEYKIIPQVDDKPTHNVSVSAYRPLRNDKLETPPAFAGTFWFTCSPKYIRQNQGKAKALPATDVKGVRVQVLEWAVAAEDKFKAFHAVGAGTQKGGRLRLRRPPVRLCPPPHRVRRCGREGGRHLRIFGVRGPW